MKKTPSIAINMRKELEYRGLVLETAFVDDVSPDTLAPAVLDKHAGHIVEMMLSEGNRGMRNPDLRSRGMH